MKVIYASTRAAMHLTVHESIDDIPAAEWNRIAGTGYPFARHEFLAALQHHGCVGEALGWVAQHLALRDPAGELAGAVPMYLKDNSYGELVFDWSWAEAYARAGLPYYPKLVVAIPYTPATGPRLLHDPGHPQGGRIAAELIEGARGQAERLEASSVHWLFPPEGQLKALERQGLMRRTGYQFHWENRGYRDFEDFLDTFTAHKRKKLKRERRRVAEAGIDIELVRGDRASDGQIEAAARLYGSIFDRKWGMATLNLGFFREVAETMGEQLLLWLARDRADYVAGAICFRSDDTLYGRHWGSTADYHSLHFELCYYQGIEYCIENGLRRFEPGAQGEHKVSRGFLPTPTWSAHWIADARFREAIADFLRREHAGVEHYMQSLREHLPYKAR